MTKPVIQQYYKPKGLCKLFGIVPYSEYTKLIEAIHVFIESGADYFDKYNTLLAQIRSAYYPEEFTKMVEFYDGKHPTSEIVYTGLHIPTKKYGDINPTIPVVDFIQATSSIRKWVESKGIILPTRPFDLTPRRYSEIALEIYETFIKETRYLSDNELYGLLEQWQMPSVSFWVKRYGRWLDDCEGFGNLCLSLILSVLPRGLARVTAGLTNSGIGHASLTAWDYRTEQFEQWETTSGEPFIVGEDDAIYIKKVWFSFDYKYSWSELNKKKYETVGGGE